MIDIKNDTIAYGENLYDLSDYRVWLLYNHPTLCNNHLIKKIFVNGRLISTFDWQHIYFLADQYQIIKTYLNELPKRATAKIVSTNSLSVEGTEQDQGQE